MTAKPGNEFTAGVLTILPVLAAVVAYGLLFGALAVQKGLSPLEVAIMSATVFAGASQFVAVEIWSSPPSVILLGATALLVNLRHVLMGAALAPFLKGWSRGQIYGGLHFMADENWAFTLKRAGRAPEPGQVTPAYYLGLALPLYGGWIACSTLGAIFGGVLQDPARYGFDFAFTAVFLTLLVSLWQGKRSFTPWLASALVAVAAHELLPGVWYIVLGGLAGTVVGALQAPPALPARYREADDAA